MASATSDARWSPRPRRQRDVDAVDGEGVGVAGPVKLVGALGLPRRRRHADDLIAARERQTNDQLADSRVAAQPSHTDEEMRDALVHARIVPRCAPAADRPLASDVPTAGAISPRGIRRPQATARTPGGTRRRAPTRAPPAGVVRRRGAVGTVRWEPGWRRGDPARRVRSRNQRAIAHRRPPPRRPRVIGPDMPPPPNVAAGAAASITAPRGRPRLAIHLPTPWSRHGMTIPSARRSAIRCSTRLHAGV
jgi:hypothetical protein